MKKSTFKGVLFGATVLAVIALITLISVKVHGQTEDIYIPDRPGYAANAYLVGVHRLDYEVSLGYTYCNINNDLTTMFYETNAFRFGIMKHLELRAGFDVANINFPDNSSEFGVRSAYIGAKIPIIKDTKYRPAIGILASTVIPKSGAEVFAPVDWVPSAALLLQKSFGYYTLIANTGVMWDGFTVDGYSFMNPNSIDKKAQGTYAVALYEFSGNVGFFFETYGYYSASTKPYNGCDFGFSIMTTPNLEADISVGLNYETGINNSFVNIGLGWRIPNKGGK